MIILILPLICIQSWIHILTMFHFYQKAEPGNSILIQSLRSRVGGTNTSKRKSTRLSLILNIKDSCSSMVNLNVVWTVL